MFDYVGRDGWCQPDETHRPANIPDIPPDQSDEKLPDRKKRKGPQEREV